MLARFHALRAASMSDSSAMLDLRRRGQPLTAREYIEAVARELGKVRGSGLLLSPADASGVAKVEIRYGDKTTEITGRRYRVHAYRKPGRYHLTVYVTDKAGNVSKLTLIVRITAKPKKKAKGKGHTLNLHASTPLPARGHRD